MGKLFGTDGVRGVAGEDLSCELALNIGRGAAAVLTAHLSHRPRILIGKDTRISGDMLENALAAGLCSVGADVELLGVIPTPAVAYLVRLYGADAGVVISASHNPVEFNGIKIFSSDGYKLPDEVENEIEAHVLENCQGLTLCTGPDVGRVTRRDGALDDYVDYLAKAIDADLSGLRVAVDCANGAASQVAKALFPRLGADCTFIGAEPDGCNINLDCGSTHPEALQALVVESGADVGLAFDGDADRLIAVDETGKIVDGDEMLVVCGRALKEKGQLPGDTVVATVMSNMGLDIALRQSGIRVERTAVGDRYVLERMLQGGYVLGGEQSGHIIFLRDNTTGDGIQTALHLLSILTETGQPLSALAAQMQRLPQVLVNVPCAGEKKHAFAEDTAICARIGEIEAELAGCGRVLVRPSGTEALVRVMLEGPDEAMLHRSAEDLAALLRARLS